jgi:hypothetical protein
LKNESIKDEFDAKGLDEAKETLDVMKLSPKSKAIYDRKIENKRLKKSLFNSAKADGRRERDIEIAKVSLKQNISIDTISLITGLSIEEIEDFREGIK